MTNRFKPESGLVIVRADLSGPAGAAVLRLALDTGATQSVVSSAILVSVGYDPAASSDRVQVTTGSGIEFAPRVVVRAITAINRNVIDFSVLALTLPPSAGVDGLLGLDFLRGCLLKVDFLDGTISLG
jgi:predicted aspartyl protease